MVGIGWGVNGKFLKAKEHIAKTLGKRNVVDIDVSHKPNGTFEQGGFDYVMPIDPKSVTHHSDPTVDDHSTGEKEKNAIKQKLNLLTNDSFFNGVFANSTRYLTHLIGQHPITRTWSKRYDIIHCKF